MPHNGLASPAITPRPHASSRRYASRHHAALPSRCNIGSSCQASSRPPTLSPVTLLHVATALPRRYAASHCAMPSRITPLNLATPHTLTLQSPCSVMLPLHVESPTCQVTIHTSRDVSRHTPLARPTSCWLCDCETLAGATIGAMLYSRC